MEDVHLQSINGNRSESLEQAEKIAKICNLNESLVAKVNDLEPAEPVQDAQSNDSVAAQQEINEFKEELQIQNRHNAMFGRLPNKHKSKPEAMEPTDIWQLLPEKDMPLHHVKDLSLEIRSMESELKGFEPVIQ